MARKAKTTKRDIPPIHPGEILLEDFLKPMGITQYRLAKSIGVQQRRISLIVKDQLAISADTALRLGRYFNMEPQFWLNLQAKYDLDMARIVLRERLDDEVTPRGEAA